MYIVYAKDKPVEKLVYSVYDKWAVETATLKISVFSFSQHYMKKILHCFNTSFQTFSVVPVCHKALTLKCCGPLNI